MTGIHFNIWAIIILFGAAQGLFLSVYLFTKPQNRDANKWLALLLTVISLHLIEYAADIAGITLQYPIFIAITYPLLFCMGPFYYIYCRYLLDKNYSTNFQICIAFFALTHCVAHDDAFLQHGKRSQNQFYYRAFNKWNNENSNRATCFHGCSCYTNGYLHFCLLQIHW